MAGPVRAYVPPPSPLTLPVARLPLTPFETMMWLDDRPGYPMVFGAECRLSGRFKPELLEQAWNAVSAINPMLSARLTLERGKPCWMAGPAGPPLEWMPPGWLADKTPAIDLRTASGCRGEVHEEGDETRLVVYFHHAATDGIGSMIFFGDLLAAYHRACYPDDTDAELRKIDPARLLERGRGPLTEDGGRAKAPVEAGPPIPAWRKSWNMLRIAAAFAAAPVTALAAAGKVSPASPAPGDRHSAAAAARSFTSLRLPAAESDHLRAKAAAAEATVNDVLLAAFFRTLARWNEARGKVAPRALYRLTMPVNLRTAADKRMPSANVMGYAFLERPATDCIGDGLLAGLRDESRSVQTSGVSVREFSAAIGLAAGSPWIFKLGLQSVRTFSTAVLSNLGDPTRRFASRVKRRDGRVVAGELELLEICGAPPVRPGTRASLAIFQYDNRLSFGLATDPQLFTRADAVALLDALAAELMQ